MFNRSAKPRWKRLGQLTVLLGLLAAVLAPLAIAGPSRTFGGCPGGTVTPFTKWGDFNLYQLVPGGSFETKPSWTLSGGASVVSGNETYFVNSKTDKQSLSLPAGASATTPPICVTTQSPLIRFFAVGGSSTSALNVDVIATLPTGAVVTQSVAKIPASTAWNPTPQLYFFANLLAYFTGKDQAYVQFRFTPTGSAGWKIDDLYLDPRKS